MKTILVGTAVTRPGAAGAVFVLHDGVFEPVGALPANTGFQALTAHPARHGEVYAAAHCGLYKSTNFGADWRKLSVPSAQGEHFWALAIHPRNPDVLLAGVGPVGVYKSSDAGMSWRRVGSSEPMAELTDMSKGKMFQHSRLMRLAFDPTQPNLVVGACETNGFILSEDEGETWRNESAALVALMRSNPALRSQINVPDDAEGILDGHAVCITPERPGVVYYACRVGLFSTADLGRSWRDHQLRRFAPIEYSRDVQVSARHPKTMYLALSIASRSNSGALYRSDDVGETWSRADESAPAESTIMGMNAHASDGRSLVYVTRGGQVHWTEDDCATWNAARLPASAGDAYCAAIL